MNKTSNVKAINKASILQTIYKEQSMTKSQLASALGLTIVTINNLVAELVDSGICIETGNISNGGRKAAVYGINNEYGCIIGLNLTRTEIICSVYDVSLNEVLPRVTVKNDILDVITSLDCIKSMLRDTIKKLSGNNILGIGLTIPGRASDEGLIINIPDYPQWNSVDIKSALSDITETPIYVDNDVNAMLLSSKWTGLIGDADSFVYLQTDDGLGAGFMFRKRIFYGSNNQGCEIGHISISPDGPLCRCGRRGCLQAYIGKEELLRRIGKSGRSDIRGIDDAIIACKNGDSEILNAFIETTSYICMAIRDAVMLFDPELIILQNQWMNQIPELFSYAQKTIYDSKTDRDGLPVRPKLAITLNRSKKVAESAASCIVLNKVLRHFEE
ncbi:MAG: ROK family protein [Clostridia bacterium]|nr:ROK family protein [Clostridia bacterium]